MPAQSSGVRTPPKSGFVSARPGDIRKLHGLYAALPGPFFVDISGPTPGFSLPAFSAYCRNDAALYVQRAGALLRAFFLLCYIQPELEMANLDFAFFSEAWNGGAADRDTFDAALRAAFAREGISRVQALLLREQPEKIVFLEGLGFEHEGVLREHFYHAGQYRDLLVYARSEQRRS